MDDKTQSKRWAQFGSLMVLGLLYLLYVVFVLHAGRGPVDYETFMAIGARFLDGKAVYGKNSYYPLPTVMIFAVFSQMPFAISVTLWLIAPVLLALWIAKWKPWVLAYAPLFGHFVGGQSSVFGLLGLWGYRRHADANDAIGGVYLGIMMLKPQLGILPLAYAVVLWWQTVYATGRLPRQFMTWLATGMALFLPSFFVMPDWPLRWLRSPRPLFARALVGFVPRTLLLFFNA